MPDLSSKIIKMAQAGSTKERRPHVDSGFLWQLDQKKLRIVGGGLNELENTIGRKQGCPSKIALPTHATYRLFDLSLALGKRKQCAQVVVLT
jgi:hypothetical protein